MPPLNLSIPKLAEQIPDEASAYEFLEQLRWGDRPVCPHCGSVRTPYFLKPQAKEGRKTRTGKVTVRRLWKCADCRKQFSVLTGTIFHGSKIAIRKWLFVIFEMCASKHGVSAREVQRKYELTPKSAWFMTHRIREAMRTDPLAGMLKGTIVADETGYGGKPRHKQGTLRGRGGEKHYPMRSTVFTLIDRDSGEARSRVIPDVKADTLWSAIARDVETAESRLMTDEHKGYGNIGRQFGGGHDRVFHSGGEYVRGDVSTNAVESYFSQLKRSIDGTHHAVSHQHLHRYLSEFDFRYSTRKLSDSARMARLMGQVAGRRMTYR